MLYKEAAQLASRVAEGSGLKQLLYSSDIDPESLRGVAFLATNALKQKKLIDGIINGTDIKFKLRNESERWMARILVTELCLGRKSFAVKDRIEKLVYSHKKVIKALAADVSWGKSTETPRYVRVNTLVTSLNQILAQLKERGFTQVKFRCSELTTEKYLSFLRKVDRLEDHEFLLDIHVPNLLVFNRKAMLAEWDLVDNGTLLLQDKSSCFVAPLVAPHPGSVTLDMCAAPGFKTQHLATFLHGLGGIIAVDKSEERYKALSDLTEKFELNNVKCLNKDALECLDPEEREKIDYILLDPPCSGSGVVTNYDFSAEKKKDSKRLQALHNLQCCLLRSALTNYPAVRRVVYSTCSMNEEENEQVIEEFAQPPCGFQLVDLSKFYKEVSCGFKQYSTGRYCIRLSPVIERTNGFFIAMFERLNPGKTSESEGSEREAKLRRITLEEYPSPSETTKGATGPSSPSSTSSEETKDDKEEGHPQISIKIEKDESEILQTIIKEEKCDLGYDASLNPSSSAGKSLCSPRMTSVEEYEMHDVNNPDSANHKPILSVSVHARESPVTLPVPSPPLMTVARPVTSPLMAVAQPVTPQPLMTITPCFKQNVIEEEPMPPEPEWPEEHRDYGSYYNDGDYRSNGNHQYHYRFSDRNQPPNRSRSGRGKFRGGRGSSSNERSGKNRRDSKQSGRNGGNKCQPAGQSVGMTEEEQTALTQLKRKFKRERREMYRRLANQNRE